MIQKSKEIIRQAELEFNPYAKVLMVSGGNDSLATVLCAKALGVEVDFIAHVNTRTGIQETTEYVRSLAEYLNIPYIEGDAGNAYEKRVLERGFFGKGIAAHAFAYRILKATNIRKAISRHIRNGKRNRPVLLLNGARLQESKNRKNNLTEIFNRDPASKNNIWVNLIHTWSKSDCLDIIDNNPNVPKNEVTALLHRSGECMCGTMQSDEDRATASFFFPNWGNWLNNLEKETCKRGFCWKWGEATTKKVIAEKTIFMPMCQDCQLGSE